MLYLVISTPQRSRMTQAVIEARLAFRDWLARLGKKVICFYPRKDRGAVVIFNLRSERELRRILDRWNAFVRVRLDVYPLSHPDRSRQSLESALRVFMKKGRGN